MVGPTRVEAVRWYERVRFWIHAYFSYRANQNRCAGETKREGQKDCKVLGLSQWQAGVTIHLGEEAGGGAHWEGLSRAQVWTGEEPITHPRGEVKR